MDIPLSQHHDYLLAKGGDLDVTKVPEGRTAIPLSHRKNVKMPEVGQPAPEISAEDWINLRTAVLKKPMTLADLQGKVVLLEFWATWCGPCVECIPHLNDLNQKYAGRNFQLLTFVEEGHETMDKFLKRIPVGYLIGLESAALDVYGISEIPHAFVVDQTGKIAWHGYPAEPDVEAAIANALNGAK